MIKLYAIRGSLFCNLRVWCILCFISSRQAPRFKYLQLKTSFEVLIADVYFSAHVMVAIDTIVTVDTFSTSLYIKKDGGSVRYAGRTKSNYKTTLPSNLHPRLNCFHADSKMLPNDILVRLKRTDTTQRSMLTSSSAFPFCIKSERVDPPRSRDWNESWLSEDGRRITLVELL